MTIDKLKLKALAEATSGWENLTHCCSAYEAGDHNPDWYVRAISEDDEVSPVLTVNTASYDQPSDAEKLARYYAAVHPKAVLELIAENEALCKDAERNKRMLLVACVSIGSVGEALGLDMDADADMMIGTARDLIEALNRIIKECPLGSPGFAIATEVLGELGVQQEDQQ